MKFEFHYRERNPGRPFGGFSEFMRVRRILAAAESSSSCSCGSGPRPRPPVLYNPVNQQLSANYDSGLEREARSLV